MFKSLKTRYLVTALIVMVLLAVAALVRGGDTVNPPPCPCTDTVYIVDTVYVPNMGQDTLYEYILDTIELRSIHNLIFDFSTAAKQAARRTNEQFGGHPDKELNSINNKEK